MTRSLLVQKMKIVLPRASMGIRMTIAQLIQELLTCLCAVAPPGRSRLTLKLPIQMPKIISAVLSLFPMTQLLLVPIKNPALPRASMGIRMTTVLQGRVLPMCLRVVAPPGRSRLTSRLPIQVGVIFLAGLSPSPAKRSLLVLMVNSVQPRASMGIKMTTALRMQGLPTCLCGVAPPGLSRRI